VIEKKETGVKSANTRQSKGKSGSGYARCKLKLSCDKSAPERNNLWHCETKSLVEQAIEIDVDTLSSAVVKQDVVTVAVTQTDDVTHHAPNCR
jgi:hypothetical protein